MAFNSSGVTRTRKVPAFACPFGNGGRPAFLAFGIPKLQNDCGSYRQQWRRYRVNVKHGHMALRFRWIVRIVRPCVNFLRFWMTAKLKNFHVNKFRKLGFITYNGGLQINTSLLSVVLHD
jgi:hypothetical protein